MKETLIKQGQATSTHLPVNNLIVIRFETSLRVYLSISIQIKTIFALHTNLHADTSIQCSALFSLLLLFSFPPSPTTATGATPLASRTSTVVLLSFFLVILIHVFLHLDTGAG